MQQEQKSLILCDSQLLEVSPAMRFCCVRPGRAKNPEMERYEIRLFVDCHTMNNYYGHM